MKIKITFFAFLFLLAAAGCSKLGLEDASEQNQIGRITDISVVLPSESHTTRMTFYEGQDAQEQLCLCSKWSDSDAIVVTPDAGNASNAVLFNLVSGQGSGSAVFRPEKELSSQSKTWTVYYPSSVKCDADYDNFSFDNQLQCGDNDTRHLSGLNLMRKRYSFSSSQSVPEVVEFSGDGFEQSSCIKFVLEDLPEAITPMNLKIEVFAYSIMYWSSLEQYVSENVYFSRTMSFDDMQKAESLTAYMMLPPSENTFYKGHYLRLTLTGKDGKKIVTERVLPEQLVLTPGTYNTMSINKNWVVDCGVDGTYNTFQTATASGITTSYCNLIIMGDGYTAEDYQGNDCKFMKDATKAYEAIFSIEPFKSLKQYFGVYYVNVVSGQKIHTVGEYDNGALNVDTHTALGVKFTPDETEMQGRNTRVLYYAGKVAALSVGQVCRSAILVIANKACHAGSCVINYAYQDSDYSPEYSIAYLALGNEGAYQEEDFRQGVIHELGGHGFGKLADEYTLPRQFSDLSVAWGELAELQNKGIYKNVCKFVSGSTTIQSTPWASLASLTAYAPESIGVYQGAYAVSDGFCRSTPSSIMRDLPTTSSDYFNAMSRKMIYHRVMRLIGKTKAEAEDGFLQWDASHLPQTGPYLLTKSAAFDCGSNGNLRQFAAPTTNLLN